MVINYFTMKWGNKYGPEYVNRLYWALKNRTECNFNFYCYTDNSTGFDPDVNVLSISDLRDNPAEPNKLFTSEKIYIKTHHQYNCYLDLDILITGDLSLPIYRHFEKYNQLTVIKNYWGDNHVDELFPNYGRCYINTSIMLWKDNDLAVLQDIYHHYKDLIDYKYADLDTWMFHHPRLLNVFDYIDPGIVYSYVNGADPSDRFSMRRRPEYKVVLFNTSHGRGVELDEATGWPSDVWKQFG